MERFTLRKFLVACILGVLASVAVLLIRHIVVTRAAEADIAEHFARVSWEILPDPQSPAIAGLPTVIARIRWPVEGCPQGEAQQWGSVLGPVQDGCVVSAVAVGGRIEVTRRIRRDIGGSVRLQCGCGRSTRLVVPPPES